ncbi:MAG: RluA family pseudouridine synthase [Candidatus Omnitrophica bacterium]|nr:RluA family pseudouridine synthase [Candidatus Omnitrophota bacterium]
MHQGRKIPRRYQPKGFEILFEDDHIIVGNKAAGFLTVGAAWERENTVHHALNAYVRKGNSRSHKCVFVVHRLDQHTSGVLIFAKSPRVQELLKDNWKNTKKTYYAVVHGSLTQKQGLFESYLFEDDKYVVHSIDDAARGKFAQTKYEVVKEANRFSLVKINLLTGRKNQIRVHFADAGHPVAGDAKYGRPDTRHPRLALHSQAISFPHPVTREQLTFETEIPEYFDRLMNPPGRRP